MEEKSKKLKTKKVKRVESEQPVNVDRLISEERVEITEKVKDDKVKETDKIIIHKEDVGEFNQKDIQMGDEYVGKQKLPGIKIMTKIINDEVNSDRTSIKFGRTDGKLSDFSIVQFPIGELEMTLFPIKFGTKDDIPIFVGYERIDDRRYKMFRKYPFKFDYSDFINYESAIAAFINMMFNIAEAYDFVMIDGGRSVKNQYSLLNNSVVLPNLTLSVEENNAPIDFVSNLIVDDRFQYVSQEQIYRHYLLPSSLKKDEINNIRIKQPFTMDSLSMLMFKTFYRDLTDTSKLPKMYKYGLYDLSYMNNWLRANSSMNIWLQDRSTEDDVDYVHSRSYVYSIIDVNPEFKQFLTDYRCNYLYINEKFSKVFMKPLIDAIKVSFLEENVYRTYLGSTNVGISSLRKTLPSLMIGSYIPSKAPNFLNAIYSILADPEVAFECESSESRLDPVWLLDKICFMVIFKPQVCTRSYAGSLFKEVCRIILAANSIVVPITITNYGLYALVSNYLPVAFQNVLVQWLNWVNGVSRYDAIYSNVDGAPGSQIGDGMTYWGKAAFQPFRILPINEGDDAILVALTDSINFPAQRSTIYNDWSDTYKAFLGIVLSVNATGFLKSYYYITKIITDLCARTIYVNRVPIESKSKVVNIQSGVVLSFLAGVNLDTMVSVNYDVSACEIYVQNEMFWFSKACMVYKCIKDFDEFVYNFFGIRSNVVSQYYLKRHVHKYKVFEFLPNCMLKNIIASTDGSNRMISNLDVPSVPGGVQRGYFEAIEKLFINDFTPNSDSLWCVHRRAYDYLYNIGNLVNFGISDHLIFGKGVINSYINSQFRIREVRKKEVVNCIIDYKREIQSFGGVAMKTTLNAVDDVRGNIKVFIPTFVDMKRVTQFSEVDSGFNNILMFMTG